MTDRVRWYYPHQVCLFICNLDLFRIFTSSATFAHCYLEVINSVSWWDIPLVSESSVQFVVLTHYSVTTDILLRHILGLVHVFAICLMCHHLSDVLL